MSQEDANRILAGLEKFVQEATANEQKAREALIAAGLIKPNGQPTEHYRS